MSVSEPTQSAQAQAAAQAAAQADAQAHAQALDVKESLQQLGETSAAGAKATVATASALAGLVAADLALARAALLRVLVFAGVAVLFVGLMGALLIASFVALLVHLWALSWPLALLLSALLCLLGAGVGALLARSYLKHTQLQATRRQLARLIDPDSGELAALVPALFARFKTQVKAESAAAGADTSTSSTP